MANYYEVLDVARNASQDDIKKQYRKLARKYHPDRSEEVDAEEKFKELNTAYQTLKDPHKRAEYDNPQPSFQEFSFQTGGGQSLHDILQEAMGGGRFQQQRQQPVVQINISLEEAFTGTTRTLNDNKFKIPPGIRSGNHLFVNGFIILVHVSRHRKFQRSHDDLLTGVEITAIEAMLGIECQMKNIDGKIIKIKIPAGIQHGKLVRATGMGMPNPEINIRGDLLIQVVVKTPENLTNDEKASIINVSHRKTFAA